MQHRSASEACPAHAQLRDVVNASLRLHQELQKAQGRTDSEPAQGSKVTSVRCM